MGVRGLWKLIERLGQERSLLELSLDDSLKKEPGGSGRLLRVGVDANIWMQQCERAFCAVTTGHTRAGENPELRSLFYKLARLLRTCMLLIFVFDGPWRPSVKHGRNVIATTADWITVDFKELIEAFGFCWHQAPGEAEAELATLNRKGLIDAVITEDSDAFIFGATEDADVNASMPSTPKCNDVVLFTAESIESDAEVLLSHDGLILMAVLIGGDYNKKGLKGCGVKIAHNIAKWTPLARRLVCKVKQSIDEKELASHLQAWREDLCQVLLEDTWLFPRSRASIASLLTPEFPPMDVLQKYVRPETSWSRYNTAPNTSDWRPRIPDLGQLTRLCERMFLWGTNVGLQNKFRELVWPGMCLHVLLLEPERLLDYTGHQVPTITRIVSSNTRQLGSRTEQGQQGLPMYRIKVSTGPLVDTINANIQGLRQEYLQESELPRDVIVTVPASVLDCQLPAMARDFNLNKL